VKGYFDHSATTPPYPEVVKAIGEVMLQHIGNPSSLHRLGMQAEQLVTRSRQVIGQSLGVPEASILFTSGGTESNNLALKGISRSLRDRGRHLVTTAIEHASVYEACRQLEQEGYEVTYIQPDKNGIVSADAVMAAVRDDTILVSVMHVNNETGAIQPVEQIGKQLQALPKTAFHVDAVQGIGKVPFYPHKWGVDMATLSAHKLRGPKGIGLLYVREGLVLQPLMGGGAQENGLRPGTENVPLIVGTAKAIRLNMESMSGTVRHMQEVKEELIRELLHIPSCVLNSPESLESGAPHIVNVSFPGVKSEVMLHALEQEGYYVSTQSACSSRDAKASRILKAMGVNEQLASSAIRISLSPEHTLEDVRALAHSCGTIYEGLQTGGAIR